MLEDKCMEMAYRLCEIGSAVVDGFYGSSASISIARTQHGARINIDGEDVLFIEFGAGDAAGTTVGLYDAVPVCVRKGSWSETHAQMYSTLGYWYWPPGSTNKIYEVTPTPAAYYAYREMILAIPQVAKEILR